MDREVTINSYSVNYYDEETEKIRHYRGLVAGATYADCVARLVDWYGEDSLASMTIVMEMPGPYELELDGEPITSER